MSGGERLFKWHAAGSKVPQQILLGSASEPCCPLSSLSLEGSIRELLETLHDILQWPLSSLEERYREMSERINNLDGQVAGLENHTEVTEGGALSHTETLTNTARVDLGKKIDLKYSITLKRCKTRFNKSLASILAIALIGKMLGMASFNIQAEMFKLAVMPRGCDDMLPMHKHA